MSRRSLTVYKFIHMNMQSRKHNSTTNLLIQTSRWGASAGGRDRHGSKEQW